MTMANLLKNGDFSTGKLAPWTAVSEETVSIKEEDGKYFVQLNTGGSVSQSLGGDTHKFSTLTFDVRAGVPVKPGETVLFVCGVYFTTPDGPDGNLRLSGASKEWREITLNIDTKSSPVSLVKVFFETGLAFNASQNFVMSEETKTGTVHFRNFRLI